MIYYVKLDGKAITFATTIPQDGLIKVDCGSSPLPASINENYKWVDGEGYIYNVTYENSGFNSYIKGFIDTGKLSANDMYSIAQSIYNDFNLYKTIKISKLSEDCNLEILGGFQSDIHYGVMKTFEFSQENQINLESLKNNIALGLISDGNLTYYAKGEPCEIWSNADFMKLYETAMAFKIERIQRYKLLKEQVLNCDTREKVDAINW